MQHDLQFILNATQGQRFRAGSTDHFSSVTIDSRAMQAGELFVCIRGDRFDGHDFLPEVVQKGAAGIILSETEKLPALSSGSGPFVVRVPDTLRALQDLAHLIRMSLPVKVVGVTGTNGKSSAKEMIASVTATRFNTLKSRGNLNNHIGLPLNLFDLKPEHEVAILEMGMSAKGEIARLAEIAKPEIGLITNISEAHMVHLSTVRDVQEAKGELFKALPDDGTAIVNADDPLVLELARSVRAKKITFGVDQPADVRGLDIKPGTGFGFEFSLATSEGRVPVCLPFPGLYNVHNAVAAAAAGIALGIEPTQIAQGLENTQLLAQRVQVKTIKGMTLLDDTYNANPKSMLEALKTLGALNTGGNRFFVIGDMFEMGELEQRAHQTLGEQVAKSNIDCLVAVGPLVKLTTQSAVSHGFSADCAMTFDTHEEASEFLRQTAKSGDALLFKGSRGAQMERVLNAFCKES